MTRYTVNGLEFRQTGRQVRRSHGCSYVKWTWITADDERPATAAEARSLNRQRAAAPPAMSLPSAHPSYRV